MNSTQPKIFIVIVNYNGLEVLDSCLNSVFSSNYPNIEVVLVDNNSKDGSLEIAKRKYQKSHFIINDSNLGFAKAVNLGIRFSLEKMADYVLLLNSDAVLEKRAISNLIKNSSKDQSIGVLSPLIYDGYGEKIWFSGGKINWKKMKATHSKTAKEQFLLCDTDFLSGCAMFIKKDVFKKIGLFDERFFLYYEDVDFTFRAKKEGFSLCIDRTSTVFHKEISNKENKDKVYWLVLSGLIFFKKNSNLFYRFYYFFYIILRRIKNWINLRKKINTSDTLIRKAYLDYKKL